MVKYEEVREHLLEVLVLAAADLLLEQDSVTFASIVKHFQSPVVKVEDLVGHMAMCSVHLLLVPGQVEREQEEQEREQEREQKQERVVDIHVHSMLVDLLEEEQTGGQHREQWCVVVRAVGHAAM